MQCPLLRLSSLSFQRFVPRAWKPPFGNSLHLTKVAFLLLTGGSALAALPAAQAQDTATLTVLYSFSNIGVVSNVSALVQGSDGNFYGTTYGGSGGYVPGTVYEVTPQGVFTTLHTFSGGVDGGNPVATVVQGNDGNFYGTTSAGGANGDGTVYRISSTGDFTTLYTFSGSDGSGPYSTLVQGSDGSFYGTTIRGGANDDGTLFRITPAGALMTLHSFNGSDGSSPSGLVQGSDGNFYGTTSGGGLYGDTMFSSGDGTIFQITLAGVLTTLHNFNGSDGASPTGLVQGSDGNFYGTTYDGAGTVFQITPGGALTTLHSFDESDGEFPNPNLVQGSDGNFYGTTGGGGASNNGTVFQITGAGVLTTLYSFTVGGPSSGLVEGSNGDFYGTTQAGGANNNGTIFELSAHPAFFTGETALDNGVYYLAFSTGNFFGYYSFLSDPNDIYHFDLGYEYVFDANDGKGGVYFYDFASRDFFYTSPTFPFPYLYDFDLQSVLYYYPDPNNAGHYNTNGIRYFYVFNTGQIIAK